MFTRLSALLFAFLASTAAVADSAFVAPVAIPATTCTNQFIRSVAAVTGVGTCASVANADLTNSATTVNGQTCTLGSTCTVAAAAGTLTGATLASGVTASSLTSVGATFSMASGITPIGTAAVTSAGDIVLTPANSAAITYGINTYFSGGFKSFNTGPGFLIRSDGSSILQFQAAPSVSGSNTAQSMAVQFSIGTGGAITMPGLASTSAAQTGTLCWATGTGNITVDTTTTCLLSGREFKHDIRPIDNAVSLKTVLALRPSSYFYNDAMIPDEQIGFIADEVAEADERLVARGTDGKPRSVRYQQLTADLAGAIQAQQKQLDQLRARRWCLAGWCW